MPFLVIDYHGAYDGNSLEDCIAEYATENEMLVAVETEAKEIAEHASEIFKDWVRQLEVFEIVRKVPVKIETAVTVEIERPETPDPLANVISIIRDTVMGEDPVSFTDIFMGDRPRNTLHA